MLNENQNGFLFLLLTDLTRYPNLKYDMVWNFEQKVNRYQLDSQKLDAFYHLCSIDIQTEQKNPQEDAANYSKIIEEEGTQIIDLLTSQSFQYNDVQAPASGSSDGCLSFLIADFIRNPTLLAMFTEINQDQDLLNNILDSYKLSEEKRDKLIAILASKDINEWKALWLAEIDLFNDEWWETNGNVENGGRFFSIPFPGYCLPPDHTMEEQRESIPGPLGVWAVPNVNIHQITFRNGRHDSCFLDIFGQTFPADIQVELEKIVVPGQNEQIEPVRLMYYDVGGTFRHSYIQAQISDPSQITDGSYRVRLSRSQSVSQYPFNCEFVFEYQAS